MKESDAQFPLTVSDRTEVRAFVVWQLASDSSVLNDNSV
jgi:hypothetical protein